MSHGVGQCGKFLYFLPRDVCKVKLIMSIINILVCAGLKTPDTTQYEALKLLCSLVMMLLGNGFYGAPGLNTDTQFVDQGTNKHVSPPEDDGPIIV